MAEVAALAVVAEPVRLEHGLADDAQMPPAFTVEEEARLISVSMPVVIASQATFVIAAAAMFWLFNPLLTTGQAQAVGAMLAVHTLFCLAFDVWFARGGLGNKRVTVVSRQADVALAVSSSSITILLVWFGLPNAGLSHWMVATAICVGFVPMMIAACPDYALPGKISIVMVLGGLFLFLLLHDWHANLALLIMIAVYSAALFYLSDMFLDVVKGAIAARRLAEQAQAELEVAVEAVAAERDAKTRFIAAISHDLAQPLQAARLFAERAKSAADPWQRDDAIRQTQSTLKATQAMLGQLLYHMRLEADEVAPQVQPVRLDWQLRDLVKRHADAAATAGMTIRLRCPALELASDPVLLDRAVGNLLSNAIVHSGASVISVIGTGDAAGAKIFVMDNGRGVAPEEAQSIFADYSQGSRAKSGLGGGFGLGLASVARVARLLGGSAGLHPRRRGAAFWISLSDGAARS